MGRDRCSPYNADNKIKKIEIFSEKKNYGTTLSPGFNKMVRVVHTKFYASVSPWLIVFLPIYTTTKYAINQEREKNSKNLIRCNFAPRAKSFFLSGSCAIMSHNF